VTLVAGEAGIGKTSMVKSLCSHHDGHAQVLWGWCDPLSTTRPLGPLYDIARAAGGESPGS
jgi:predicted ATPase